MLFMLRDLPYQLVEEILALMLKGDMTYSRPHKIHAYPAKALLRQ